GAAGRVAPLAAGRAVAVAAGVDHGSQAGVAGRRDDALRVRDETGRRAAVGRVDRDAVGAAGHVGAAQPVRGLPGGQPGVVPDVVVDLDLRRGRLELLARVRHRRLDLGLLTGVHAVRHDGQGVRLQHDRGRTAAEPGRDLVDPGPVRVVV